MIIAKVVGSIVATTKDERLNGKKLLVVQPLDLVSIEPDGKPLVSVDTIGSGIGEVVMVVAGGSARQTKATKDTPVDSAIIATIDHIDIEGVKTYKVEGAN